MDMENPKWFEFLPFLNASKSRTYRESVTKQCTSLMKFFIENSLVKIYPLDENGIIKSDLVIFKNDFTEEGQYLFKSGAVFKWLGYTDNGGRLDYYKHLEKALEKYKKLKKDVLS